jgi:protein-tyrosine-phosphatase
MRVHFICNGNAYRSRMAKNYFDSLQTGIESVSSGVRADKNRHKNVPAVTGYADSFLSTQGIEPHQNLEPIQVTQEMLDTDDVYVIINDIVLSNMKAKFTPPKNFYLWDITDHNEQVERNLEDHTSFIFDKIKKNVDKLVQDLTEKQSSH